MNKTCISTKQAIKDIKMTQVEIEEGFLATKAEWERMFKDSNKSRPVFLMSKEAIEFLCRFSDIRKEVIALGLTIPMLEPTITTTEHSGQESKFQLTVDLN